MRNYNFNIYDHNQQTGPTEQNLNPGTIQSTSQANELSGSVQQLQLIKAAGIQMVSQQAQHIIDNKVQRSHSQHTQQMYTKGKILVDYGSRIGAGIALGGGVGFLIASGSIALDTYNELEEHQHTLREDLVVKDIQRRNDIIMNRGGR